MSVNYLYDTGLTTINTHKNLRCNDLTVDGILTANISPKPFNDGFFVFLADSIITSTSPIIFPESEDFITSSYGFNSGILNLTTGVITIAASGKYSIACSIIYSNTSNTDINPDAPTFSFHDVTNAQDIVDYEATDVQVSNKFTYNLVCNSVELIAGHTYDFRLAFTNTLGSLIINNGPGTFFSMQRVQ